MGDIYIYTISFLLACIAIYYLFFSRRSVVKKIGQVQDGEIVKDEVFHSGFWHIASIELRQLLERNGQRSEDYVGWSLDLVAREGVLEEGETTIVEGKATWIKASRFGFKLPVDKVLYIEPADQDGVYITDDPYA